MDTRLTGSAVWASTVSATVNIKKRLAFVIRRRTSRKRFLKRVDDELRARLQPPQAETDEGEWSFQTELRKQMAVAGLLHHMSEGETKESKLDATRSTLSLADLDRLTSTEGAAAERMDFLTTLMEDLTGGKSLAADVAEALVERFNNMSSPAPLVDVPLVHGGKAKIIGSIAGCFDTLRYLITTQGIPSPSNVYIFNGRYVAANTSGCSVLLTLLGLKLAYPNYVHVLRGATEDAAYYVSSTSPLRLECARHSKQLFYLISKAFGHMPFGALVQPPQNLTPSQVELENNLIRKAAENSCPFTNLQDVLVQYRYPTLVVPGAVPPRILVGQEQADLKIDHLRQLPMTEDSIYSVDPGQAQTLSGERRVAAPCDMRVDLTAGRVVSQSEFSTLSSAYTMLQNKFALSRAPPTMKEYLEVARLARSYREMREASSCTFYSATDIQRFVEANMLRQIVTSNFLFTPVAVALHSRNIQSVSYNQAVYTNAFSVLTCTAATKYKDDPCFAAVVDIDWKGAASFVKFGPDNVKPPSDHEIANQRRFLEIQVIKKLKTLLAIRRMDLLEQFQNEAEVCPYQVPGCITIEAWSRSIQLVLDLWLETCDAPLDPERPETLVAFAPKFLEELFINHKLLKRTSHVADRHRVHMVQYREFLAQFSPFSQVQTPATNAMGGAAFRHLPVPAGWDDALNSLSTILALCAKSSELMYNYLDINADGELSLDEFAKGMLCVVKTMDAWCKNISTNKPLYESLMNQPTVPTKPSWPLAKKLVSSRKNTTTHPPRLPMEPNPYHHLRKSRDPRILVLLNAPRCVEYWDELKLRQLAKRMDKDNSGTISKTEFLEIFSNFTGL